MPSSMKKALQRKQSLSTSYFESKADFLDRSVPDLYEEIYCHPQVVWCEYDQYESPHTSSPMKRPVLTERNSKCRSLPLPIPIGPQSKEIEREEELHQEQIHMYNDATWKMYHLIQNARKAKSKDRNRSHSAA